MEMSRQWVSSTGALVEMSTGGSREQVHQWKCLVGESREQVHQWKCKKYKRSEEMILTYLTILDDVFTHTVCVYSRNN